MRHVIYDSEGNDITDEYFAEVESIAKEMDDPKMSCRETVLEEAKRCICQDRQNQYGAPEDSFFTIAQFWSTYLIGENKLNHILSKEDVALMMVLLKVARTNGHKHHVDNYVDMAGYAALAAELAQNELEIK